MAADTEYKVPDWTEDTIPEHNQDLPVSKRLARKLPKYTAETMDKNFAKKFIAMHQLTKESDGIQNNWSYGGAENMDVENPQNRGRRRSSIFDLGAIRQRFGRRKTQFTGSLEKSIEDFRRTKEHGVNEEHVEAIKTKYGIRQEEISKQERYLKRTNPTTDVSGNLHSRAPNRRPENPNMYSISEEHL